MKTMALDIHKGSSIMHLAATYPLLGEVIEEAIQNSIDSEAKKIVVKVNWKQRFIAIRDNGVGVGELKFSEALRSVANSIKTPGKLGQFGIGFVAPLGKCEYFTFTSCEAPSTNTYVEWTLNTEVIRNQKEEIFIPFRTRHDLVFGDKQTWWRTQVEIHNFTTDKYISTLNIDTLKQSILTKYSQAMLRIGTTIHLIFVDENNEEIERKFRGNSFTGKPLPELTLELAAVGKVTFRMFITNQRHRRAKAINIRFGEAGNDFRVTYANFGRSVTGTSISPDQDVLEALRSGVFEGEIIGEHIKLTPQRTCFKKDDAFIDLCLLMNEWYAQQGKHHYQKAKNESQEVRYQNLGVLSLQVLEKLLKKPEYSILLETIKNIFPTGNIGEGHSTPNQKILDVQSESAISTQGGPNKTRTQTAPTKKSSTKPSHENPKHVPFSSLGPRGKYRRLVRSNSVGIQFAHDTMYDSPDLWKLDKEEGVIVFNITHPLWTECDKNDTLICRLQEHVALQVLTLEMMPDKTFYQHQKLFSDEYTKLMVKLFVLQGVTGVRKK